MTKQTPTPVRRKWKAVLLGAAAAGLALAAVSGVAQLTPSTQPQAAERPGVSEAATSADPTAAPSTDGSAGSSTESSTAPSVDASAEPSAGPSAGGDQASEEVPDVSDAVGVAPPAPAANDAELALVPQKENEAVELDQKVQVLEGMTVEISDLAAVAGVADEPGEVSGDAVKVSVTLTNTGSTEADTSGVLVDLEAGPDAVPGMALQGAGATFPATIAPGESATAEYVFVIDPNLRDRVSVLVNYTVTAPIAVFEGAVPPAEGKS